MTDEGSEGAQYRIRIKLADLLHDRKMSQVELSQRIGMHPTNLNKLVGNRVTMLRMETMLAICAELDCQPGDWIVRERVAP